MNTSQALTITTVIVFAALALAYQLIRLWQEAVETITDALHELDEEGQP
ncbi:hypothetical protein [Streptomyces sp. NPDC060001]